MIVLLQYRYSVLLVDGPSEDMEQERERKINLGLLQPTWEDDGVEVERYHGTCMVRADCIEGVIPGFGETTDTWGQKAGLILDSGDTIWVDEPYAEVLVSWQEALRRMSGDPIPQAGENHE